MSTQQYAVIGLGRFGTTVAEKLYEAGQEVLGIDIEEGKVDDALPYVTHAIVADSTDEKALTSVGIRNFETVIVSIGDDMQSSILTVLILKELGVKKVIAKALSKRHGKVLKKVGADTIIYPERDMGERLANLLLSPNTLNYIELSKEFNIEEIMIPSSMVGKSLRQIDLRAIYNISVIAVVRNKEIIITPSPDEVFLEGDILVMIGRAADLTKFSQL
ncbi:potassium channel family protein [Niallia sp. Krafla_26]|uniref:potassium channel family protein n=1 Tax=Niallia sp. Krafla_26 TaxID=3064703 RepID=UPI003D164D4A